MYPREMKYLKGNPKMKCPPGPLKDPPCTPGKSSVWSRGSILKKLSCREEKKVILFFYFSFFMKKLDLRCRINRNRNDFEIAVYRGIFDSFCYKTVSMVPSMPIVQ